MQVRPFDGDAALGTPVLSTCLAPLSIGSLVVDPPLVLAPMVGLTHPALLHLISDFGGCGLFYSEMLSARSIPLEDPTRSSWLFVANQKVPVIFQLLASKPGEIGAAIDKVAECGAAGIDLNMGCTTASIIKRGGGVALMRDVDRAKSLTVEARRRTQLPLTAKIRLGWTHDWNSLREFCRMLEDSGVDAIVLHPRTKADRFKRPAQWEYVGRVKSTLGIPVIGNGDVDSVASAMRMFSETRCDGVMVGRAAVERPWLFRDIVNGKDGERPETAELFVRFVELLSQYFSSEHHLKLLRKFVSYFAHNFDFGHSLWTKVHNASTMQEATEHIRQFCATHRPSWERATLDVCSGSDGTSLR